MQPDEIVQFKTAILNGEKHDSEGLKAIAMVAKLGDIFHADKHEERVGTRWFLCVSASFYVEEISDAYGRN